MGISPFPLEDLEDRKVTKEEIDTYCKENDIFWCGEFYLRDISKDELYKQFKLIVDKIYKKLHENKKNKIIIDNKNDKTIETINKDDKKVKLINKYKFFYKIFNY